MTKIIKNRYHFKKHVLCNGILLARFIITGYTQDKLSYIASYQAGCLGPGSENQIPKNQLVFCIALQSIPTIFMLSKQPHILVVDDNEEILATLSIILNRKDYKVSAKDRVENFEQAVEELFPDLILLDINLGWADGCDLCRSIKANKKLSAIPVIMFSAYYKKRDACIDAGADEFIEKPFEMHALLETIQVYAGSRKMA